MTTPIKRRKPWSVADTENTYTDSKGNLRYRVLGRFGSQWQAKNFVGSCDPDKLRRGVFELCGPEEAQ